MIDLSRWLGWIAPRADRLEPAARVDRPLADRDEPMAQVGDTMGVIDLSRWLGWIERALIWFAPRLEHDTRDIGRSLSGMGAAEVRTFLLHLTERRVRARTFNVYVGALQFLYRVTLEHPERVAQMPRMRVPMHVPTVLTGVEVERILGAIESDKYRVAVMLAYGAGLRIGEVCHLRVEDIDAKRMLLHIRNAKRGRERHVMLSARLLGALREGETVPSKQKTADPIRREVKYYPFFRRLRGGAFAVLFASAHGFGGSARRFLKESVRDASSPGFPLQLD